MSYKEGALAQLLPLFTPEYTLVLKQIWNLMSTESWIMTQAYVAMGDT
jgi:hypothetical protein